MNEPATVQAIPDNPDFTKGRVPMRRHQVTLLLMIVVLLSTARSASADGIIEWLERLSGPGSFKGFGVEVAFACHGVETSRPGVDAPDDARPRWHAGLDCRRTARNRPRISAGVKAAFLTGDNNLEYDTPLSRGADTVQLFSLMGFADYSITRNFDVGAGLGVMRFTGFPAEPFARLSLQALRFTWKPLTMRRAPAGETRAEAAQRLYRSEWLQVRYVATVVPGGFNDRDFGARPASFDTGTEFLSSINIILSFR